MKIFIFAALLFLSYVGGKVFAKFCSNLVVGGSVASYTLYCIFNGCVACVFFFIMGGFRLSVNLPTLIYSVIFAWIVIFSTVGLVAYKLADVATVTILTGTCGLIATSALGAILFRETVETVTVIRILIMLVAMVCNVLDQRKPTAVRTEAPRPKRKLPLLICVILAVTLSNAAVTVITKFYALDPHVTDENSFFFFTNVFLILFSSVAFLWDSIRHREHFHDAVKLLRPKKAVALVGNTVCSNVSSLVGILLIALIDVSVYSPLTSALGIISGVAASLLFREKLGVLSYLAALIACVAVFI
jgi:drug/metabolite transporter (DMT)-like permease